MTDISKNKINFYFDKSPCSPVLGLVRSILALGTFLTLFFNSTDVLFFDNEIISQSSRSFLEHLNFFRIFNFIGNSFFIGRIAGIVILFLVIIGWRPRVTGIFHWWIVFSFTKLSGTIDGGDQIGSILALFLIPLTLLDSRKWHWDNVVEKSNGSYMNMFLWSLVFIIRLQISFIYFHAAVEKFKIEEWINGTSTYYWFNNTTFGASGFIKNVIAYLTTLPIFVTATTWGTLILEIVISMAIFMDRKYNNWRILLFLALLFHLGIVLIFGLISFYMTMGACLVLYLVPLYRFKSWRDLKNIFNFHELPHFIKSLRFKFTA